MLTRELISFFLNLIRFVIKLQTKKSFKMSDLDDDSTISPGNHDNNLVLDENSTNTSRNAEPMVLSLGADGDDSNM